MLVSNPKRTNQSRVTSMKLIEHNYRDVRVSLIFCSNRY